MNKPKLINHIIIPVVVAFTVFFAFVAIRNYIDSRENQTEYEIYDRQTVRLVIGSELLKLRRPPLILDNEIALDLETVRRYIDKTVDWDAENKKVTVTTRDKLVRMNTDNLTAFVNDWREVRLELPVFEEDGVVYLPLKFLSDFFEIRVYYDDYNKVVIVDDRRAVVQSAAIVEKGAVIRLGRSIKEPVVKSYGGDFSRAAKKGAADAADIDAKAAGADADAEVNVDVEAAETDAGGAHFDMYVFEDYDGWYKVRSLDGIIGYIEKRFVAVRRYVDRISLTAPRTAAWKPETGKIVMVWEQVASAAGNPDTSKIPDMPGLDVVSPTWFHLTDGDGGVESRASASYIDWAHKKGYQVWALFANKMNDIGMTSDFLNNSASRENAIRALLAYTAILNVDGINLDFENVYLSDRDALTQFVRELAPVLREQGLTFSVDVNVPDGSDTWSRCYDTPRIAEAADYVNLMAYDQFGAKSGEAGSVSQLSWVESNLKKLIERDGIPPEKILLGIPFYTRVWEMQRADAERGGQPKNSSAIGMKAAIGNIFDYGAEIEWDAASGQFFCKYIKDGKTYHVWLEDPQSANLRSSLAHKYALAGVSAWSRNFVIPEIWDVLRRNLKDIATYYQWKAEAYTETPDLAPVR